MPHILVSDDVRLLAGAPPMTATLDGSAADLQQTIAGLAQNPHERRPRRPHEYSCMKIAGADQPETSPFPPPNSPAARSKAMSIGGLLFGGDERR
jgi:hypothetical protein